MFQFKQESYTGNFTISQSMIHGTQMDVTEGDSHRLLRHVFMFHFKAKSYTSNFTISQSMIHGNNAARDISVHYLCICINQKEQIDVTE
jgi:hypothetical protein